MNEKIQAAFAILGAISTILTILGGLIPARYKVGQWCARLGADLKGVHAPKADQ